MSATDPCVPCTTGTDAVLEEVSQVFEVYDADKTGSLLEEEFVQAIQLAGDC